MKQAARVIDSRAFAAGIVLLFGIASGLAVYYGDCIVMYWGESPDKIVELSIVLQPWIIWLWRVAKWVGLPIGSSMPITLIPSLISSAILFCLVRLVSRRSHLVSRGILCALFLCTCGDIGSFLRDMLRIRRANELHIAP